MQAPTTCSRRLLCVDTQPVSSVKEEIKVREVIDYEHRRDLGFKYILSKIDGKNG